MYDLIIIGLGPAGLNAGVYATRAGLKTLALEKDAPGGLLLKINNIDNYLGMPTISGSELAYKMFEHFNNYKVPYKVEEVMEIVNDTDYKIIKTNKNTYKTKNILITTGIRRKKIKTLDRFIGKGVSYCTVCDAPLYKNKDVAVIGNDDAIKDVEYLKPIVNNLYFININKESINIEKENDKFLLSNDVKVDGVFINLGGESDSSFDLSLNIRNEKGFIEVDKNMETKVKGIYAAGDVIEKDLRQICTALNDAAIAVNKIKKDSV